MGTPVHQVYSGVLGKNDRPAPQLLTPYAVAIYQTISFKYIRKWLRHRQFRRAVEMVNLHLVNHVEYRS